MNLVEECIDLHKESKIYLSARDFDGYRKFIKENFINNFDKIEKITLLNKLKTILIISKSFVEIKDIFDIISDKYEQIYDKL